MKKTNSSGLCMGPRVHALFELFTLGFVETLYGNEKRKRKHD